MFVFSGRQPHWRPQIRGSLDTQILASDPCHARAEADCDGCEGEQCTICLAESVLTCCEETQSRGDCCESDSVKSQAPENWDKCVKTCAGNWGDCGVWQCCESEGFTCYSKHEWYAQCRSDCSTEAGKIDEDTWECKVLGGAGGGVDVPEPVQPPFEKLECVMDGQNCMHTRCCQDPGKNCYVKNEYWSGCRPTDTCTKDEKWEEEAGTDYHDKWSCMLNDVSKNPFKDSSGNHQWYKPPSREMEYNEVIGKSSGTIKQNLIRMRDAPSAIWMWGKAAIPQLTDHLERAAGASEMQTAVLIMYNIPNRDCAALASSGEICCKRTSSVDGGGCSRSFDDSDDCSDGVYEYKTEFVDPIVAILRQYETRVRLVVVVEPDSLANLATNLDHPVCGHKATQTAYKEGIAYVLKTLATKVTTAGVYLDSAHGGWLGWKDGIEKLMKIVGEMDVPAFHGFATNVANYQPLGIQCPFCPDDGWRNAYCFKGQHVNDPCCADPCGLAPMYNPSHSEMNYAVSLQAAAKEILGIDARVVIDTGRNGNPSGRTNCGTWCNPRDMGAGVYPTANVRNSSLVDAFFWFKTLGESDGCSEILPSGARCPRFDEQCAVPDSLATHDDEPRAPDAGTWYEYSVKMYAQFAQFDEPVGRVGPPSCLPLADTGVNVGGNGQLCAGPHEMCGGKDYNGTTCCQTGCSCRKHGETESKCEPPLGTTVCDGSMAELEPTLPPTPAPPTLIQGCRVTTYMGKTCDGNVVKTYQTTTPREYRWRWGYQENWPNSAKLEGSCGKVEFYDEDNNRRGDEDNIYSCGTGCVDFPYDLEEDLGGFYVEPGTPPTGGCTVTTFTGFNCNQKKVATYSSDCTKEFKWNFGYQENWPNSAMVTGQNCDKVEFYDEDNNKPGYGDNVWKHGEGCVRFPFDLQEDLGGLKIWAK